MRTRVRMQGGRVPLLTAAQERELAAAIEQGRLASQALERARGDARADAERMVIAGEAARRHFIEANIGLVHKVASTMRLPSHVDRADVVQDGIIGLDRAIDRFDGRRGYRFSTYATWWIRQAMHRGLENTASAIRVPVHRQGDLRRAIAEVDAGSASAETAALAAVGSVDSLQRPLNDSGTVLADFVPAPVDGPEVEALGSIDREAVRRRLRSLDPTTMLALTKRFGLDGSEPATLAQIGAALGVSGEAVRRRLDRALLRLRDDLDVVAA